MDSKRYAPHKYPWTEWFDAGRFTLVHGRDYDCLTSSMRLMVKARARKAGIRVHVTEREEGLLEVVVGRRGSRRG